MTVAKTDKYLFLKDGVNRQLIDAPAELQKEASGLVYSYTPAIELPYDKSTISINVAALSYTIPELNQYAYKLERFDRDWTPLKSNRTIYYTKLQAGKYVLKIKGSNSDGIWNEKETSLYIKVLPPIWAGLWAYALYACIGSAIIMMYPNCKADS